MVHLQNPHIPGLFIIELQLNIIAPLFAFMINANIYRKDIVFLKSLNYISEMIFKFFS